ncbi:MAG: hypothetical protein ACK50N_05945, partial [Flavobacteriales bacterium]
MISEQKEEIESLQEVLFQYQSHFNTCVKKLEALELYMQEMSFTAQIERRKKEFENEAHILSSHCFLQASRGDFDGWEIKTEDFV